MLMTVRDTCVDLRATGIQRSPPGVSILSSTGGILRVVTLVVQPTDAS
jgi:hypothetical protein